MEDITLHKQPPGILEMYKYQLNWQCYNESIRKVSINLSNPNIFLMTTTNRMNWEKQWFNGKERTKDEERMNNRGVCCIRELS
jgi:hypothetical protein